jgi:arylsulfatase
MGQLKAHEITMGVFAMSRRSTFCLLFVLTLATGTNVEGGDQSTTRKPNILFIMTDQQRWDCVGVNGNSIIRTPHLDQLASEGANFTHAFVQAPVCVPSRASFFTGRYPHSHKNRVNYTPLDRREILLQARLRDANYATASVGKLHLYPPTVEEAKRSGFNFAELHDGVPQLDRFSSYVAWRQANDPQAEEVSYRAVVRNPAPTENPYRQVIDAKYTETGWVGERTRHYLRHFADSDRPFFLFSSFWRPHDPFEVPEPFDAMYNEVSIQLPKQQKLKDIQLLPLPLRLLILRGRPVYDTDRVKLQWMYRSYYGAISHIDREIGTILKVLQETGQADNTIVVFTSDHGDQMLEHGLMGKNCFFDSSVRVPLMIRFPNRVVPGHHNDLVESIDVLPTLFELAGLPEPTESQGRSLVPLITKSDRVYEAREAVFSENIIPEVITSGRLDFQFIKGQGISEVRHPDAKMVRTNRWKYNYYPEGFAELYDLQADPQEMHNLAGQPGFEDTEHEMKDRLLHWLTTADEPDQIAPRWLRP